MAASSTSSSPAPSAIPITALPTASGRQLSMRGIVTAKIFAHKLAVVQRARRHLWDEAFGLLSKSDAAIVSSLPQAGAFKVDGLISTIHDKIEEAKDKSWKYTRSNGDVIVLRNVLEKTLKWIERFQSAMDVAVSSDVSGHAAIPWAFVKFLLTAGLSSVKTRGELVEAVEYTSRIVTLYAEVEIQTLRGTSRLKTQLTARMVELYTSILTFFAKVKEYLMTNSTKRFVKGIVQSSDSIIGVWLDEVKDMEEEVLKVKGMVDAEEQRALLIGCKTSLDMQIAANKLSQAPTDTARRMELRQWLDAILTTDTLANARAARSADTCTWILEREAYKTWIEPSNLAKKTAKLLWIHAGPGFGKTVLSASLVDHLQTTTAIPIASFFVVSDDKMRRDTGAILRSWMYQIVNADLDALNGVYEQYKTKSKNPPVLSELWDIFGSMIKEKRYCFIVDGYDECTTIDKESKYQTGDARSQFLRRLIGRFTETESLLLIVSRDKEDIRSALDGARIAPSIDFDDYGITTTDTRADVQALSRAVTSEILANKADVLQEEIATEAADRADGLFLWINLLRKKLEEERGQNAKQLRAAVREMPDGLESAYMQEFTKLLSMTGDRKERAMAVLRWVLFATRPMTVRELAEALILSSAEALERYPSDELPDDWASGYVNHDYVNSNIRLACGSLVELRRPHADTPLALHTVHFVHFSVKEFLLRPVEGSDTLKRIDAIYFPDAATEHDRLATLCLHYLCYDIFGTRKQRLKRVKERLHLHPFLRYAAKSWPSHALSNHAMSNKVLKSAERLFDISTENWRSWSEVFEAPDRVRLDGQGDDEAGSSDSSAAYVNDNDDTRSNANEDAASESDWGSVTSTGDDQNARPDQDSSAIEAQTDSSNIAGPIYYAAWLGLTDMIKTLQASGLSCDTFGGSYGTPLQAAIANRHGDTVEYLISQGVDVRKQGGQLGSAIRAAVQTGSVNILRLLVSAGADLRDRGSNGRSLMHLACWNGDAAMVDALLEFEGASDLLSEVSCYGEIPLHEAIQAGSATIVKILLQRRFDINFVSKEGASPLTTAILNGHEDIVRMLLRSHADITHCSPQGVTTLHMAAGQGMHKCVKYLIEHQVDVSAQTKDGWTALHYAATASKSRKEVMTILLNYGAHIDATTEDGTTPLHLAAANNTEDTVVLLLNRGANIDAHQSSSLTALSCAIMWGIDANIQVLLDHGADLAPMNISGNTALDVALQYGNPKQVEILLSHDALCDVSIKAPDFRTSAEARSLQIALLHGQIEDVLAVLADRSDWSLCDLNSILLAAATFGAQAVASQLLTQGASVRALSRGRRSLVHLAAFGGHKDLADMFIRWDVTLVHTKDVQGRQALDRAVIRGLLRRQVVEVLLEHGALDFEDTSELTDESLRPHGFFDPPPLPPSGGSHLHNRAIYLVAKWSGIYTYSSWNNGRVDPTSISFEVDAESEDGVARFHSNGQDEGGGAFFARGLLRGNSVRWVKLYDDHGWIYVGNLDQSGTEITGRWGSSVNKPHGTFTLTREE